MWAGSKAHRSMSSSSFDETDFSARGFAIGNRGKGSGL
jgi:hypothetical protein